MAEKTMEGVGARRRKNRLGSWQLSADLDAAEKTMEGKNGR